MAYLVHFSVDGTNFLMRASKPMAYLVHLSVDGINKQKNAVVENQVHKICVSAWKLAMLINNKTCVSA